MDLKIKKFSKKLFPTNQSIINLIPTKTKNKIKFHNNYIYIPINKSKSIDKAILAAVAKDGRSFGDFNRLESLPSTNKESSEELSLSDDDDNMNKDNTDDLVTLDDGKRIMNSITVVMEKCRKLVNHFGRSTKESGYLKQHVGKTKKCHKLITDRKIPLSGSNYPILAKAYNALKTLYIYLEIGNMFDSFNIRVMKQLLLAYLTHYFPRNDNNEQYYLMRAAAYVDPPEHLSLDNDELEKAEVYINSLYDRLRLTLYDETSSNTAQQQKPGADELKDEDVDTENNHLSTYELLLGRTGIRTQVVNSEENISLEFDR
ncbi:unnamed protein product, partial [Didymodactylos carnosus]